MKTLILAALLLIAVTATPQSPDQFVEDFIIYTGGSIFIEKEEDSHTTIVVKMPSHYDQELLVAKMKAHLFEYSQARYIRTWRYNTDMRYQAAIMYHNTLILFQHDAVKKLLYIIWAKPTSSSHKFKAGPQLAGKV